MAASQSTTPSSHPVHHRWHSCWVVTLHPWRCCCAMRRAVLCPPCVYRVLGRRSCGKLGSGAGCWLLGPRCWWWYVCIFWIIVCWTWCQVHIVICSLITVVAGNLSIVLAVTVLQGAYGVDRMYYWHELVDGWKLFRLTIVNHSQLITVNYRVQWLQRVINHSQLITVPNR